MPDPVRADTAVDPAARTEEKLREAVLAGIGDGARVIEKVLRHVLIVAASTHYWRGSNQIEEAEVNVKGVGKVDAAVTSNARWKLLPPAWRERFHAIETAVRRLVDSHHAIPFPIPGVRFVPIARAEGLFAGLRGAQARMEALAEEFASEANYAAMRTALRSSLDNDDAWSMVEKLLPTRHALKSKCRVTWVVVPIGTPAEDALADPAGYVREAREATRQMIAESVCTLLTEPRREIAEAVGNLVNLLEKEGKRAVRSASLNNVIAAFDKLRSYEFLADDDLLAKMKTAERELKGLTPQDLNADAGVAKGLAKVLRTVVASAGDAESPLATFNRFNRSLDFDD